MRNKHTNLLASTLMILVQVGDGAYMPIQGRDHRRDYQNNIGLYLRVKPMPPRRRDRMVYFVATLNHGLREVQSGIAMYDMYKQSVVNGMPVRSNTRGRIGRKYHYTTWNGTVNQVYELTSNSNVRGWDSEEELVRYLVKITGL